MRYFVIIPLLVLHFLTGHAQFISTYSSLKYSIPLQKIVTSKFDSLQLSGKGVKIGIIDSGFGAFKDSAYSKNCINQIVEIADFVDKDTSGFYSKDSNHGTKVFKYLAGRDLNIQYGLAIDSKIYLARSIDTSKLGTNTNEENTIKAIDWLVSKNVKIISASLGFGENSGYQKKDMNGNSTKIAKHINGILKKKDIVFVFSAGNEYDFDWKVVISPADVEKVLTIGCLAKDKNLHAVYSSVGPESLSYIKPNIVAETERTGTSYTTPLIAGFIACNLEYNPDFTNSQIKSLLEKSGNLYPYGNNFVGYGKINSERTVDLLLKNKSKRKTANSIEVSDSLYYYSTPSNSVILFNKKDFKNVLNQKELEVINNIIGIKKEHNIKFTTILDKSKVIEIIWK